MSAVYFRTDGNEQIATGHIMRCLSIARACRSLFMEVSFLVSDEKSISLLEERFASPGSLTLPFKPHNTQILYLSLLWAYFFVKFVKIMCASLR